MSIWCTEGQYIFWSQCHAISSVCQYGAQKGNTNNIKDQHFRIMEKSCLIQIINHIFLTLLGWAIFMIWYRIHRNGKFLWHSNNSFIMKEQLIDSMVLPLASHMGNIFYQSFCSYGTGCTENLKSHAQLFDCCWSSYVTCFFLSQCTNM